MEDNKVVIVGSGIIGIACAYYLTNAGLQVTVIDKGSIAGECSRSNCGYICPSHVPPLTEPGAISMAIKSLFNRKSPFRVKPSFNPSLWYWMSQFARRCTHEQVLSAGKHLQVILDASMEEYQKLVSHQSLDCEWKEDGLLYVFLSERAMEAFAETDDLLTEHFGVSAQRLMGNELTNFDEGLNNGLVGGFHYPKDRSVRPELLNREWVKELKAGGVQFIQNCELQKTRRNGNRITSLTTTQGEMEADHVIFCLGVLTSQWANELECRIPLQPGKGYSMTMDRPDQSPIHPILIPEHKVAVSPFDKGLRLGSMMEFSGYDTSIPESRIQQLRDSVRPYLRASVDGAVRETWYGWRPMTWDSLPVIGPVPSIRNAYLATGHNMLGLSLAPSTGRLISEMVTGETPHIDPTPYLPSRF